MDREEFEQIVERLRHSLESHDLNQALEILDEVRPADQADIVSELESPDQVNLLINLEPSESADVLEEMEDEDAWALAQLIPPSELADILEEMETDEAVDVLAELPPDHASDVLEQMETPTDDLVKLMTYPGYTAGGLMTTTVITLLPQWTVNEAITQIRNVGRRSDTTHYLYVINKKSELLGVVSLKDLVSSSAETVISDIMETQTVTINVATDQEECVRIFAHYGYLSFPVVDDSNIFLGAITADDVLEVAEDEATEDMFRMAGISGDEKVFGPTRISILKRLPWLVINLVTIFIAISVIDVFENVIAGLVILAVFLPVVSGEGGNAGTQTATIIVRGIALGEVSTGDMRKALTKEILVSLLNGALIGIITGGAVYAWKGDSRIALAICLAMVVNFLVAAIAGVLIPLGLKKLNTDPAISAAAFVTAFTDTFGFLLFLGFAALLV